MNNSTAHSMIRVYGAFPFDRAAKTRWLLAEMKLPYENKLLKLEEKEHEQPEYMNIHPMGRIPAIQVGDCTFFESGAMLAYLADLNLDKGLAPQLSSPDRAIYQQWMYFAVATLDPIQSRIMIIEDIPAGELCTQKESALLEEFRDAMGALNKTLSKNSYLVANKFSAADISVSYQLYWTSQWPELKEVTAQFPSVVAYLDRVRNLPSALEANVFSYEA